MAEYMKSVAPVSATPADPLETKYFKSSEISFTKLRLQGTEASMIIPEIGQFDRSLRLDTQRTLILLPDHLSAID